MALMHADTEKYLKDLFIDSYKRDELICLVEVVELMRLAFCLGYNHGYLAVDEKMIPSEFLQEFMQKGFESDMIISLDNDGEI
jgi:hypothetical protein